jgi:phosphoesterase recJ domain protein
MSWLQKPDNFLKYYLKWPVAVIGILIFMSACIHLVNKKAGVVMVFMVIVTGIILLTFYYHTKDNFERAVAGYAMNIEDIRKRMLDELDMPYAVTDKSGGFAWRNQKFNKIIEGDRKAGRNIRNMFPELKWDEIGQNYKFNSTYKDRKYKIIIKDVLFNEVETYAFCLYDESEYAALKEITDKKEMVVGLIYLDNYDEAMESVEAVKSSLLIALIDRKINQYIFQYEGILKRLEKDKYIFIIKHTCLEQMQESRFDILDDVKTVNIGNEMSVTLSIGIGSGGQSFALRNDFARSAMDMALGRGGDQAVVKDGESIRYFGGKSRSVEKSTRVKARVKAHALRGIMETMDTVLIMGHKNMDIDCFGSAIGIWRIAATLDKNAHIVMGNINSTLKPMVDRFIDSDDYPEDIFIDEAEARELAGEHTMLIVVDVNRPSITEAPELLNIIDDIVVLDHHRQSSEIIKNAVLSYVEPYASSACEMVAEIVQYIDEITKIKSAEADAMYAGIVVDTQNFNNQTGVRTFEAAAYLRRSGADITRVRKLFREKLNDYMAKAEAVHNAEIYNKHFAISVCSAEGVESPIVIGAQAANELLNIIGIKASIVLTKYNEVIYVSARSIDEINVQVMMEKLGGGGHRSVAGAQLRSISIENAIKRIKEVITEMIKEGDLL